MNACIKYKNELKEIDIKNCACCYFYIINGKDINFSNFY